MALTSESTTVWNGTLFEGSGRTRLDSSKLAEFDVNWKARSEGEAGTTNPEELLAAAHSACFSMAFSLALAEAGHVPESIQTTAAVAFQPGEASRQPPARQRTRSRHHRGGVRAHRRRRPGELPHLQGARRHYHHRSEAELA